MKRKGFVLGSVFFLVLAVSICISGTVSAAQSPQNPLQGSEIPQFVQALPLLSVQTGGTINTLLGNQALTIRMCEFWANVLPPGTIEDEAQTKTRVWGYIYASQCPANGPTDPAIDTYIGPVIVNDRGSSTDITWVNNLPTGATTGVLAWKYSTDQTLHWADPLGSEDNFCDQQDTFPAYGTLCAQNYDGPIPAVVHLHGGEVPPELDGGPDAWFTSSGAHKGHGYYTFGSPADNAAIYNYPNTQEAAPIWFHGHALGLTRLNVYAGLAGGYYIEDPGIIPLGSSTTKGTPGTCIPTTTTGCLPANLQPIASVIPVVIQDRMFDKNGQLFFPADTAGPEDVQQAPNPEHPYWVPEFVGDTIVVNGKAWPFLNVAAKRYRFLFLNGSNARAYELSLPGGPAMYVIGTDGGYLNKPVRVTKLVMMPGERYEVIMDFKGLTGKKLILNNKARTPYPKGDSADGETVGRIMQFRVGALPTVPDTSYNPATGGALRAGTTAIVRLTAYEGVPPKDALTRALTLNEVMGLPKTVINPVTGVLTAYSGGPLDILLNNTNLTGDIMNGSNPPNPPLTRPDFTPVTTGTGTTGQNTTYYSELPVEGTTEVWEIINLTGDAHPIHLHLVQFQLINRQNLNVGNYTKLYNAAFGSAGAPLTLPSRCSPGKYCPGYGPPLSYGPSNASGLKYGGNPDTKTSLQGHTNHPQAQEAGWKDTVIAYPDQVTRLAVRWAPTDIPKSAALANLYFPFNPDGIDSNQPGHGYVWHCHIIDHEDNEMMRPDVVVLNASAPPPASRPLVKGVDY